MGAGARPRRWRRRASRSKTEKTHVLRRPRLRRGADPGPATRRPRAARSPLHRLMPPMRPRAGPAAPVCPIRDPRDLRNPVGTHVQVGKGLVDGALANAAAVGAETIQVFVGNPRGWALVGRRPARGRGVPGGLCEASGMRVFIHTPYLVNLGSPTPATYEQSVADGRPQPRRARRDRRRGRGRAHRLLRGRGRPSTPRMRQVREGLLPVLDALGEPATACRGCCWSRPPARAGRCAPGSRTSRPTSTPSTTTPRSASAWTPATCSPPAPRSTSPAAPTATVDRIVEIGGPGPAAAGARQRLDGRARRVQGPAPEDRRRATSALGAFEELFAHPATDGVPFVLETPGSRDAGDPQIAAAPEAPRAVSEPRPPYVPAGRAGAARRHRHAGARRSS